MLRTTAFGALFVLVVLASARRAPTGEQPPLRVVVEAQIDGRPMPMAAVRWVPLESTGMRPTRQDAAAWLDAYDDVRALDRAPVARTDVGGAASVELPTAPRCLVCVGDPPHVQVRVVERGRYVQGDVIGFSLVSEPARIRTSPLETDGEARLTVLGPQLDVLEAPVWSVAGPDGAVPGTLRFDGLPPSRVHARWMDAERGPGRWVGSAVPGATRVDPAALHAKARDVRVWGQIRAVDGGPLPSDTTVRLGRSGPWSAPFDVEADGSFRWRLPPTASPDDILFQLTFPSVYVQAPGFVPTPRVEIWPSGRGELVTAGPIELSRGTLVEGHAPGVAGEPELTRWLVVHEVIPPPRGVEAGLDPDRESIERALGLWPGLRWVLAEEDGSFRTWLPPGLWRLTAPRLRVEADKRWLEFLDEPPKGPSVEVRVAVTPVRDVEVPRGRPPAPEVDAPGRVIEGRVVDGAGDPIPDALVQGLDGDTMCAARTDEQGRFRLDVGPIDQPGAQLWISSPAHRRYWARIDDLADEIHVALRPGGSALLHATSPDGMPLAGLHVRPVGALARAPRHITSFGGTDWFKLHGPDPDELARFDDRGFARMRGLGPGRHYVVITGSRGTVRRVEFDVTVGRETRVELQLDAVSELLPVLRPSEPARPVADVVVVSERDGTWYPVQQSEYRLASGELATLRPEDGFPIRHRVFAERDGQLWASLLELTTRKPAPALAPYERRPHEFVLRLEDDEGLPLVPTEMLVLATVRKLPRPGEEGSEIQRVGEWVEPYGVRMVHVGRLSLLDLDRTLRMARMTAGKPPPGGSSLVESYDLVVVRAKRPDGTETRLLPRIVPLDGAEPVRLQRDPRLALAVRDEKGLVGGVGIEVDYDFGSGTRWMYRRKPFERVATDRFGLAVLPPPLPGARRLLRVTVPPGYRAMDEAIVIPPDAKSPLEIRLERE